MKITHKKASRKGFTLVELLVVMAIIAILASVATPVIFSKLKDAHRNKAIQNLKQIGLAITDFSTDGELGFRPGQQIVDDGVLDGAAASDANAIFRQLVQANKLDSEAVFDVKTQISKKPDGDLGSKPNYAAALEKRENPYLYVDNPYSKPGAPVAACPLAQDDQFDYDAFRGKAVVLISDGSVISPNIDENSRKVMVRKGSSKVDMFSDASGKFPNGIKIKKPLH